jgi:hypothetical protein
VMEELLGSSFLLGASSLLVLPKLAAARPSSALLASACSLSSRFCLASAISCGKLCMSPNTCAVPPKKPNSEYDMLRWKRQGLRPRSTDTQRGRSPSKAVTASTNSTLDHLRLLLSPPSHSYVV